MLYLSGFIVYLYLVAGLLASSCTNVPISLDNFKFCQGDTCFIDQQVVISLQAIAGYKSCLQFISPIGDNRAQKLDISTAYSYFNYPMDNFQYFDDPKTDCKGFCGCPGGHTVNCQSNPIHTAGSLATLCSDGIHKSNQCAITKLFGTPGTWTYKCGFDARFRFKAIKLLNKFNPFVGIKFQTNNDTWYEEYKGTIVGSSHHPDFNVTVISDTMKNTLDFQYVVFDVQSPTDFWLLPASAVNDKNSFDISKLAWAKAGNTVNMDSNLLKKLEISVQDCTNNVFRLNNNWMNNAAWLGQNKNKLSSVLAPHSYLSDSDYPASSFKEDPQLHISPYHMIDNGWIYLSSGSISFVGFNDQDQPVPLSTFGPVTECSSFMKEGSTSLTFHNFGTIDPVRPNIATLLGCSSSPRFPLTNTLDASWIKLVNTSNPSVALGYALATGTQLAVQDISFAANQWPSGSQTTFTYSASQAYFKEIIVRQSGPQESFLNIPSDNGVIQISVHFKNFSVQFQNSFTEPMIDSVKTVGNNIVVRAKSKTVSGVCIIANLGNPVFTTQSISLTPNLIDYNITSDLRSIDQNVTAIIRCGTHTSNYTFEVSFNNKEGNSLESGFNSTNPYFTDIIDPNKWHSILTNPITSWYHKIYVICVIIICLVLLIVAVLILRYLFNRFRGRKWNIAVRKQQSRFRPSKYD